MALAGAALLAPTVVAPAAAGEAGPAARPVSGWVRKGAIPTVPRRARRLGALPGSTPLQVDVALEPRDPAALAAFASAVSDPSSPLYRHYLKAGQFPSMFGPLPSTVEAVERFLERRGLRVDGVAADDLSIEVSGTAAQVGAAFSVGFDRYAIGSRTAYANTAAPRLAAGIAGDVQSVIGLDDLSQAQDLLQALPLSAARPAGSASAAARARGAIARPATSGPQACSSAAAKQSEYEYLDDLEPLTPAQLASAYRLSALYQVGDEGSGETVALIELAPYSTSDIEAYQTCYDTDSTVTEIDVGGGAGAASDADLEPTLDIEEIIGLAPEADIDVYDAPNTGQDIYDAYQEIVEADTAQVVSISWGECEPESVSELEPENTLFEQAATQGQSVFAAAGDTGSTGCDGQVSNKAEEEELAVEDPASQPYVTGVGGTTVSTLGPPPTETVWNDGEGTGGGGISRYWSMPTYQSGAAKSLDVVGADSSGTPCGALSGQYCREVPDVSADANPNTGYLVYYTGPVSEPIDTDGSGWTLVGGTSMAAPLWAALTAVVDEALHGAGSACSKAGEVGSADAVGFANPALYEIASSVDYPFALQDVTSGNNDDRSSGYTNGLYKAGVGYDMASGLGTPDAVGLTAALCPAVSLPPSAATGAASKITTTTARISGTVDPNHVATRYQFDYGTTPAYGSVALASPASAGDGTAAVTETATLSRLHPYRTYYYRVVATSSDGTIDGLEGEFTTEAVTPTIASTSRSGPGDVSVSGTATPGATVDLHAEHYGTARFVAEKAVTANATTGAYRFAAAITRANRFYVTADGKTSKDVTADVTDRVTEAVAGGVGEVKVTVATNPAVRGVAVTIERVEAGPRLVVLARAEITAADGVVSRTLPIAVSAATRVTLEARVAAGDGALGAASAEHAVTVRP